MFAEHMRLHIMIGTLDHSITLNCAIFCYKFTVRPYKTIILFYCMKPPNIKAPKCTLYSALFSRVKGRKGSTVLPRLIASIVGGSLLRRAHFESLRAAEAKNAATINHLTSKRRSVLYIPLYFPGSKVRQRT